MSFPDMAGGLPDVDARVSALEARVAQLEQRISQLSAGAGDTGTTDAEVSDAVDPWSVPPWPEIVALLQQRKKIVAIKTYREVFGVGLAEAKNVIDEAARRLGLD